MLAKKYKHFREVTKKHIRIFKNKKITEPEFDAFTKNILQDSSLDVPDTVYCRDGFAFVNEIDRYVFQIACLQINSFGAGVFGKGIAKFCTPILLTVRVHGAHPYLNHNLKDALMSIEEFYLGRNFSGSRGALCDRDSFYSYAKNLFLLKTPSSFNRKICSHLINANYICHHIAETLGYACATLDVYWTYQNNMSFMVSGSCFSEERDKLYVDVIDDFSSEKMRAYFQIPHYAIIGGAVEKFREERDNILLEIKYKDDIQSFYLPSGYQKIQKKLFHENVNIITTQHIVEHVLADYYKRKNSFIVANTFQTLEYLSRAMLAKIDGRQEEAVQFLKSASACKGYYPDRNLEEVFKKEEAKYPLFASEYSYNMFFRPPVLV